LLRTVVENGRRRRDVRPLVVSLAIIFDNGSEIKRRAKKFFERGDILSRWAAQDETARRLRRKE